MAWDVRTTRPVPSRLMTRALLALAAAALPALASAASAKWGAQLPEAVSTYAHKIDSIFYLILWITGVIFVIVEALLLYFVLRYRHKEGEQRRPIYTHGNNTVEVVWTIVPAVICVLLALLSRSLWAEIKENMPKGAMNIEIQGEQFAWNIRYPGPDGRLRTDDDILTLNQLHFPVGRPVVVNLSSKDVIHSLYLPEFRVKQDAVPGMTTRIWFEATRTGNWEILCAELCGLGHYRMKGFVTVETPEAFEAWLAQQAAEAAADAEQTE